MTEWRMVVLGDLGEVVTGRTPPARAPEAFGDVYPFVTPTDMHDQRLMTHTERCLSEQGADSMRRLRVPAGSVMVSCIGWQLGKVSLAATESFTNQQLNTVIPDDDAVDSRFLYYYLRTRRAEIRQLASGGTRTPILNKSRFAAIEVALPPRALQQAIADVLTCFDELIENNRRRVEVLEEMARAIYREWFVRCRFPGHENVELVDSALGPIPDGWEVKTVGDLSSIITRGISPKYADDGEWMVLNQKCIREERVSLRSSRRQSKNVPDSKRAVFGDVLINSTGVGTLGRAAMYRGRVERLTVDSHVTIARPNDGELNPWFGLSLVAMKPVFERLGSGSTGQTELRRADVGAQKLALPSPRVTAQFADAVWPLLSNADALIAENEPLAVMRDRLLPKLVAGQIDVSSLDLYALVEGAVA